MFQRLIPFPIVRAVAAATVLPDTPSAPRVALAVVLCWLGAISAAAQVRPSILGQVRAEGGLAIRSDITLRLETADGAPVDERHLHSQEQFEFSNLRAGMYRLTVTAEGFLPLQRDVDLTRGVGQVMLNLYLTPASKPKPDAQPGVTSVQEMSVPAKARREYEKGARALEERKLDAARGHFEKAVAEYPCYARAQTDLAATLTATRNPRRAEQALRKALECDAGSLDATSQLAQLLNSERRFEESEALLRQALARSPNAWQFYFHLGVADYGLRQYGSAVAAYLKVRSLNPSPPSELHVKLADVYLKQNAFDQAYAELQTYLQIDPQGRFAAKVRDIMRQMEAAGVVSASKR